MCIVNRQKLIQFCSDPGFQERLFNILAQEYACNTDYSFKTCQHRHMLKIQVDYHRYALRDRKFLLQGIPLCNRVSKKVSEAQILRGHLGEGAISLQSWLSRQVLRSSGGAVLLAKQGPSTNYPLTPNADFKTNPPYSAQVQQG